VHQGYLVNKWFLLFWDHSIYIESGVWSPSNESPTSMTHFEISTLRQFRHVTITNQHVPGKRSWRRRAVSWNSALRTRSTYHNDDDIFQDIGHLQILYLLLHRCNSRCSSCRGEARMSPSADVRPLAPDLGPPLYQSSTSCFHFDQDDWRRSSTSSPCIRCDDDSGTYGHATSG